MMEKYKLNAKMSKSIYEKDRDTYHMKECYINVFRAVCNNMENVKSGKWKIAYGYVSSIRNLLVRHCFIVDENNMVIDPTIYATILDDKEDTNYYVMYLFDDVEKYIDAIESENGYPALDKYLMEYTKQATKWSIKNGFLLIG